MVIGYRSGIISKSWVIHMGTVDDEEEKKYLLAVRLTELPFNMVALKKIPCERCKEVCGIVSAALLKEKTDGVICSHCLTDKEKKEWTVYMPPEQTKELARMIQKFRGIGVRAG